MKRLLGARALYEQTIRAAVEHEDNVGKMVIIDVETGAYGVDETGLESAQHLREQRPNARLFGIRIGYDVAVALGGVMKRNRS